MTLPRDHRIVIGQLRVGGRGEPPRYKRFAALSGEAKN